MRKTLAATTLIFKVFDRPDSAFEGRVKSFILAVTDANSFTNSERSAIDV